MLYDQSKSYADIVAKNQDGEEEYYEIKATTMTQHEYLEIEQGKTKTKYFGAATLTEWNVARLCPNRYTFVLVIMDKDNPSDMLGYVEYSVDELLSYSTIPPFKINFNIPFRKQPSPFVQKGSSKGVHAFEGENPDFNRLDGLISYYTNDLHGKLVIPNSLKEK